MNDLCKEYKQALDDARQEIRQLREAYAKLLQECDRAVKLNAKICPNPQKTLHYERLN